MKIINEIKSLILGTDITLTKLAKLLGERMEKKYTVDNLSHKLRNETIPYREIKLIADVLGYEIKFIKK